MVNLGTDGKGILEAAARLEAAPEAIRSGVLEATRAAAEVGRGELRRISPSGPGHFGYHLRDSYAVRVSFSPTSVTGKVVSSAPQARWVGGGTKAHLIAPRNKRALSFGGRVVAIVHHPKTAAQHLKERARAAVMATGVIASFRRACGGRLRALMVK